MGKRHGDFEGCLEGEKMTWEKAACFTLRFTNSFYRKAAVLHCPRGQQLGSFYSTSMRAKLFNGKHILVMVFPLAQVWELLA